RGLTAPHPHDHAAGCTPRRTLPACCDAIAAPLTRRPSPSRHAAPAPLTLPRWRPCRRAHLRGLSHAVAARVDLQRRGIRIRGVVQGVGFRPAMFRLADALGLAGFVRNDREGVWIEVEGAVAVLDRFVAELVTAAPPAAH